MRQITKTNMNTCNIFETMMLKLVFWSLGNKVF